MLCKEAEEGKKKRAAERQAAMSKGVAEREPMTRRREGGGLLRLQTIR